MTRFHYWVLTLLCCGVTPLFAQVSGTVSDKLDGSPLPGVVIQWQGTEIKTITDASGQFEIQKPNTSTVLVATSIGYQELSKSVIFRKGIIDFQLSPATSELNDVVVSGRAVETGINLSQASHQVDISQGELRKAACCNLSESFETNASVDVSFTDAVTGTRQIEMLGLSGKYVLIQRENIPFARGLNSTSGLTFIPGPFVESIQLTKGLGSVINGYESISGQINVEFLKAPADSFDIQWNGFANQGARLESNLFIGTPVTPKLETGVLLHYSNVPFAQDKNADGFADMPTGSQINFHNRWKYQLKKGWEGQAGLSITQDNRQSGQLSDVYEGNSSPWIYDSKNNRYEFFGKTGWVDANSMTRSLGIVYSASTQNRQVNLGNHFVETLQNSAYVNVIFQDGIGKTMNHSYRTGLSFQYDDVQEKLDTNAQSYLNLNRKETVPGAFFEYTYQGDGPWTVVLGSRVDYSSYFGWIYTPRFNVKYAPSKSTSIRLGGGRGQRAVSPITESMNGLASGRSYVLNAGSNPIQAEIGWNAGFSFTQTFEMFSRPATFTTDVFYTWFENKLITDYDASPYTYSVYYNSGSRSLSALGQVDFEPFKNLKARVAYKYLQSEDAFSYGTQQAFGIPKHRAFLNISYSFGNGWKVDGTWNWYGSRRLLNTDYYPSEYAGDSNSPTYHIFNAQVNKSIGKHWEVYAGMDNIGNYRQSNPILNPENTNAQSFETNRVYAPIFGRMIYAGFYYKLR